MAYGWPNCYIPDSWTGALTVGSDESSVVALSLVAPSEAAVVGVAVGGAGREPLMVSWTFLRKC